MCVKAHYFAVDVDSCVDPGEAVGREAQVQLKVVQLLQEG